MGTNVAGSTKRSVALGWGFMCFGAGQIAGPQFFRSTEAPHYKSGITSMLVNFILIAVLSQALRLLYAMKNRRRDKLLAEKNPEEIEEMKRISNRQGFEDVTDKDNVSEQNRLVPCSIAKKHLLMVRSSCFDMLCKLENAGLIRSASGGRLGLIMQILYWQRFCSWCNRVPV